ncbi:MAG: hypothetical protein IJS08_01825 [Victivallales bacterium]|nr:hypothetical protein [Victivallales bacterium]
MIDLTGHPFFQTWKDPGTGALSWVLVKRAAPIQFPFYFTNPCITRNGKYMFFYAAFPPTKGLFLGRVALDPRNPEITWYPQAMFTEASPMIAPDDSGVYFMSREELCFMDMEGLVRIVGTVPAEYIANRYFYRGSTHLSMSCDGKWFFLDGEVGNVCFAALMSTDTGEFKLLHEFSFCCDHGMFSPVNPTQILLPRDWRRDRITGRYEYMEQRLWVMDIDQTYYRNLRPDVWEGHNGTDTAHEWWSNDGLVCYVDYMQGVFECNPDTLETTHVWKRPVCHAHCNQDRSIFCADQTPYAWNARPLEILLYDRRNDIEKRIVSAMPKPCRPRSPYHLDPHPHFSPDGSVVVYMTTVLGGIDVAVSPISQFL